MRRLGVCFFFFATSILWAVSTWALDSSSIWLIHQDFVKFGKKDVYEKQVKTWQQAYGQFISGKEAPPIFAFQDNESPQYLYLEQLPDYGAIDGLFKTQRSFRETLIAKHLLQIQNTTLNFYLRSLHQLLPECFSPKSEMGDRTFIQYFVYAVVPGGVEVFESHLRKLTSDYMKNEKYSWRTWKVIFDSDVPKYVIYLFGRSEQELADLASNINFVEPSAKEILRRERSGKARLRLDLSLRATR